jgi:type II secretory pathway component PulF
MSRHRELFGDVYIETIRAAEVSGNMIEVLKQLADMLDRQYETTKSVKGALMYPICVIAALTLAVTFLLIFVVPRFAAMFEARGLALPLPTQALIGFSSIITGYWYLVLGLLGGVFFGTRWGWRRPTTRQKMDTALHKLPFIRSVLQGLAVSRFARVLGITMRSGLSLLDALEMAGRAAARPLLEADARTMREQVKLGGRLSDVVQTCEYLPPFTRRMIAAGEEAAELHRMCDIVARHYEREVGYMTKNVATIIEPIMIMGLAGVVLIIALAIFLPLWNMGALI